MGSFFLMCAKPLVQDSPKLKLHELLDWAVIVHKRRGLYEREAIRGGGPGLSAALAMFKLMPVVPRHALPDTQLEHALKVARVSLVIKHSAAHERGIACGVLESGAADSLEAESAQMRRQLEHG